MNDDQFTKLFKYMEEKFNAIDKRFDETASKKQVDHLIAAVDSFAGQLKDQEFEQTARDAQFIRLVEWARKVSAKIGVPSPDI